MRDLELAQYLHGVGDVSDLIGQSAIDERLQLLDALRQRRPPSRLPGEVFGLVLDPESFGKCRVPFEAAAVVPQRPLRDFVQLASFPVPEPRGIDENPDRLVAVELRSGHGLASRTRWIG